MIERFEGEKYLPLLDRCKFLVPDHITVAGLMQIVRRRLQLHPDQTFFLLVNEKSMVSNSMNMHQLYQQEADQDGFLYMVYTSQPAFGSIKWTKYLRVRYLCKIFEIFFHLFLLWYSTRFNTFVHKIQSCTKKKKTLNKNFIIIQHYYINACYFLFLTLLSFVT